MNEKLKATPAARRLAAERNIDFSKVQFSKEIGHIRALDVLNFKNKVKATALAKAIAEYNGINIEDILSDNVIRKVDVINYINNIAKDEHIPHDGMRKVIASKMSQSMQEIPQYTMFIDYDMKNLLSCFKAYKDKCVREGKTKPTLSDVFIKLFALAIKEYPIINSTFTDTEIVIHKDINIGLAVAVDNGLIVPNIKNADKKTLPQITEERLMLVNKARQGRLGGDDIKGGTFTISNLGGFEVEYATPIINHPESAIVVVGKTTDKVVAVDGNIGIHPVMGMSYTFDHRHLDGAVGGAFMTKVKEVFDNAQYIFDEE